MRKHEVSYKMTDGKENHEIWKTRKRAGGFEREEMVRQDEQDLHGSFLWAGARTSRACPWHLRSRVL